MHGAEKKDIAMLVCMVRKQGLKFSCWETGEQKSDARLRPEWGLVGIKGTLAQQNPSQVCTRHNPAQ